MGDSHLGPNVAVFKLGWRRTTMTPMDISGAIQEHVVSLLSDFRHSRFFRAGNVTAVHVLGEAVHVLGEDVLDPKLLLVSTDAGWTKRNQNAIDAVGAHATIDDLGHFDLVAKSSAAEDGASGDQPVRDLGNDVSIFELRPTSGHTADDVATAVVTHLTPLVGVPTRAGLVMHVSLLRDPPTDRHLLIFGVDVTAFGRHLAVEAVAEVADMLDLGSYIQHPVDASDDEPSSEQIG